MKKVIFTLVVTFALGMSFAGSGGHGDNDYGYISPTTMPLTALI